jgi:signal transduction histidine kinase
VRVADREQAEYFRVKVERIKGEVDRLEDSISHFLTFARPLRSGHGTADLREALREAGDLVVGELDKNGGELRLDLPEAALPAGVDADLAKRATLNLLRNAAQVAEHVTLKAWSERGEVVVSVCDDGPGVPAELRDRIFDPFVTDKAQGAGLGLAIVRKVAEAHGGRVELARTGETDGGRGSEFRIYFPSLDEPPPNFVAE